MNYFVHRHLLLPAFETVFKRRRTFQYWADLERSQWLSRDVVGARQFEALRRLIQYAYANCPYYRRSWDALGLHPRLLRRPADIARWPVIDRESVRIHRAEMRATLHGGRLISKSTGGSSGAPLHFDLDLDSHDRRTAAWHRGYTWAGAAPGTRQLYLWGTDLGGRTLRARLKDDLYHRLYRRRVVSCFDGQGDLTERFVSELEAHRPEVIVAYTNPLYEVARRVEETGQSVHRPRAIIVGAEKLHDFQRKGIEHAFKAPVFETYGSREFMLIGAECERHGGLHLTSEHLLVEILDDDGRPTPHGQEGNVVITDLFNYGMPFVRYANDDRAIAGFEACDCGRGLPLLKKVVGRRLDMLQASGGRVLPGEFFPHLVKDFPAVLQFQVIQDAPRHVRFILVAPQLHGDDRIKLTGLARAALGPDVAVEFEQVESIQRTTAGKLQVVINRTPGTRKAA